jgi:hypothetical protein
VHLAGLPQAAGSGVGAVAAAAVCAQSTSAVAAASGPTQLSSQDPALDSLIDRWLSHKHASTSAPEQNSGANGSGGSGGSRRQQRAAQEVFVAQEWEALLGPVTVTMASLATLEVRHPSYSQTPRNCVCFQVAVSSIDSLCNA